MRGHPSLADFVVGQILFENILTDALWEALCAQQVVDTLQHLLMVQKVKFAVPGNCR